MSGGRCPQPISPSSPLIFLSSLLGGGVWTSPSTAAVRSFLPHLSQAWPLSSSESVQTPPPLRPASPTGELSVMPPPLVEFKSFLSGDSCHRLRSSLSPPAPSSASRWGILLGSVTSLLRYLRCHHCLQQHCCSLSHKFNLKFSNSHSRSFKN